MSTELKVSKGGKRRALISLKNLTSFEMIQLYYTKGEDRVQLPPHVEIIRKRWEMAYSQLNEWEKKEDIANFIAAHFGVTTRTAYEDIKCAELLYKKVLETDWEFVRVSLMETYREALKEAKDKKKLGYIQLFGRRIQELMPKDTGHKHIDPTKLKPHTIVISADQATLQKQLDELNQRQAEFEAEDVDYEDVP